MSNPAEGNLFMMCSRLNTSALSDIPDGFYIRLCRREELDIWKDMHFDTEAEARDSRPFMDRYFERVYAPAGDEFWKRCFFLCDDADTPVGTCFVWKAYGEVTTVHWYKVKKEWEGRGLGRALLSYVMKTVPASDYPVFLHTHVGCSRAVKLYSDFGFILLTDEKIGSRINHWKESLPYLRENMPADVCNGLIFAQAPKWFLTAVNSDTVDQF